MNLFFEYLSKHKCKVIESEEDVAIEKYLCNGVVRWYHHSILGNNRGDTLNEILYCPYCGEKLER